MGAETDSTMVRKGIALQFTLEAKVLDNIFLCIRTCELCREPMIWRVCRGKHLRSCVTQKFANFEAIALQRRLLQTNDSVFWFQGYICRAVLSAYFCKMIAQPVEREPKTQLDWF